MNGLKQEQLEARRGGGGSRVVLVVSDDEVGGVQAAAGAIGWRSVRAVSADAAAVAEAVRPDLIVLSGDSFEATRMLRSLRTQPRLAYVPLLAVVPGAGSDSVPELLDAGADDVIDLRQQAPVLTARLRAAMRHRDQLVELARQNRRLDDLAGIDPLTELPNRRRLDDQLRALEALATRTNEPVGVLVVDVDRFKRCNDTFGHETGDEALRRIARALRRVVRTHEIVGRPTPGSAVGRWGGDEFVIGVSGTQGIDLDTLANRLRTEVATIEIITSTGETLTLTASVGCAAGVGEPWAELLRRADLDLMASKQRR